MGIGPIMGFSVTDTDLLKNLKTLTVKKIISIIAFYVKIFFFTTIAISCKKEGTQPVNQPNSNNAPPVQGSSILNFSGTWIGTIKVDDLNLCYYSGDPIATSQVWIVNPDSSVTIIETLLDFNDSTPWTQTWKGKLYDSDSLFISLTRTINCFGANQPMTTQLKTKIVKTQDNKYTITAKVDYPMCPPDCLFAFNYLIKKQ